MIPCWRLLLRKVDYTCWLTICLSGSEQLLMTHRLDEINRLNRLADRTLLRSQSWRRLLHPLTCSFARAAYISILTSATNDVMSSKLPTSSKIWLPFPLQQGGWFGGAEKTVRIKHATPVGSEPRVVSFFLFASLLPTSWYPNQGFQDTVPIHQSYIFCFWKIWI